MQIVAACENGIVCISDAHCSSLCFYEKPDLMMRFWAGHCLGRNWNLCRHDTFTCVCTDTCYVPSPWIAVWCLVKVSKCPYKNEYSMGLSSCSFLGCLCTWAKLILLNREACRTAWNPPAGIHYLSIKVMVRPHKHYQKRAMETQH